jgi:hypothetical protein
LTAPAKIDMVPAMMTLGRSGKTIIGCIIIAG